ncbi:MAG: glycosyltransferase family 39 protein, partial [Krumholzibacteria bacterium]|nr:glycosyltransferase family 39 protein [Candidatus Krumholzibacteria bacterium]
MARGTLHDRLLLALLAVAAAIRLVFLLEVARTDLVAVHLLDAETYHTWALRLVAGDFGWEETYWMGPLYPHLVAVVYRLLGPDGVAVQAVQLAATVLNVWLLHRLATALLRSGGEVGAAPPVALLAAALYAFYGAPVFYAGFLLMATLVTTQLLLVAWQAVRAQDRPTVRRWLVLGLLVGLTGLARGNVLLLVATLPLLLVGRADLSWRRRALLTAVLAAGALAMVAPATLRNVLVARDFALLTSNGGVNLYIGQLPHGEGAFTPALERPDAENDPSLELTLEGEFGRDLKGSEVSRILTRRAWQVFRENLAAMPRLYLLKIWRFWSGYELPQIEAYVWWREVFTGLKLLPVPYTIISALGLVGLAFLPRRARLVVLVVVLSYFLSLLPFFPTSRYRQPIAPLLAIGAAAWVCALIGARCRWRRAPTRRSRLVAGGTAAGLVVLLWPAWTALPPGEITWQVKLHESSRAARLGDLRTTLARAREAEEVRPGLAETPFLLARHLEDLGAWTEARAAIAQAAARAPH